MKVCFFCSSSDEIDKKFFNSAAEFGKLVAKENWTLVSGGSNLGLMRALTQNLKRFNGKSIGIIPKDFASKNLDCKDNSTLIYVKDLQERKQLLFNISDAFIVLPGGIGTMDEFFEILTLKLIGYFEKPLILFNQDNFYKKMIEFLDEIHNKKFAKSKTKEFIVFDNINDVFDFLKRYNIKKQAFTTP